MRFVTASTDNHSAKGNEPLPKKKTATEPTQTTLPFPSVDEEHLDISTLETWLLDAANTIRGASDAPKFKDFNESQSGQRTLDEERLEALIEGVVLLPENLFYNTSAPGIILLLNRNKPEERKEQILLINLSLHFEKGKPKNILTDEGIASATEVYQVWESREKLSSVITLEDAQKTDYNLSPSQFVDVGDKVEHRPVNEILVDLTEARVAREKADKTLADVLVRLGLNEKH